VTASAPTRCELEVADLFDWLPRHTGEGAVVTSLPDAAEVPHIADWERWYIEAAWECLRASTGPTIFVATDRKRDGRWISKAAMLMVAAEDRGHDLLWHRIALRRDVGAVDLHRPTYTHVLAFGPGRPGHPLPDVIEPSDRPSRVSTSYAAAAHIAAYLADVGVRTVLNPACGYGTLMQAANDAGMDALGCDTEADRLTLWAPQNRTEVVREQGLTRTR
jgi:hypothetical protein